MAAASKAKLVRNAQADDRMEVDDDECRQSSRLEMGQAQQELNTFGDKAIYGYANQARSLCASDPSSALIAQPRRNSKAHLSFGS
jgi:hypothetical protein